MDHLQRSALNRFAVYTLDRVPNRRLDNAWVASRIVDPSTHVVPVWQSMNLFTNEPIPRPVLLTPQGLDGLIDDAESVILLGEADDGRGQRVAYFAAGLRPDESPPAQLSDIGQFKHLTSVGMSLDRWEGGLLAYARAITHWHHRHRFCGDCGNPTTSTNSGHVRLCTNAECALEHFPRTDPAVIVQVSSAERCLLGRKSMWPRCRYSIIAGFVEPGECLEATVVREVFEETGVRVGQVTYQSSQPWPFPRSLMLGFTATAISDAIQLNDGELEDARWFSRKEMQAALRDGSLRLPLGVSISSRLIEDWFDAGSLGRLRDQPRSEEW